MSAHNAPSSPGIGIAFIGAGNVTTGPYSQAIDRSEAARLVGVYDPDQACAEALAARHGAHAYPALEDLLGDAEVEAVVVAAPTAHQPSSAIACLSAGKHVLIEKPIADTVDDIDAMRELALRHGRVVMPAHNFIYQATLEKARRAVKDGRFGTLTSAWVFYNIFHDEELASRYVGVLRQIGTHLAYSLLYLLGRPQAVNAVSTSVHYEKLEREDQVLMACRMPGGALANLWASFAANDPTSDPWTVLFKLLGTQGGFVYSWNEAQFQDDRGPAWGVPSYMDGFAAELDFFVTRAIAENETPLSSIDDARDALRILEAAERSIARGGGFETVDYS